MQIQQMNAFNTSALDLCLSVQELSIGGNLQAEYKMDFLPLFSLSPSSAWCASLPSTHLPMSGQCDDARIFSIIPCSSIVAPHSVEASALNLRENRRRRKQYRRDERENTEWKQIWINGNRSGYKIMDRTFKSIVHRGQPMRRKKPLTVGFDSMKFPLNLIRQNCN